MADVLVLELARAWINGDEARVHDEIRALGLHPASPAGRLMAHLVDEYADALLRLAGWPDESREDAEASAIITGVVLGREAELPSGADVPLAAARVARYEAVCDVARWRAAERLDARLAAVS